MTDTDPITAPDTLTALCELADMWSASVRLAYRDRRYVCAVGTVSVRYAYAEGDSVSDAIERALRQLEAAESRFVAELEAAKSRFVAERDDDECPSCYGSGGGPDAALRCVACSGRGYR